MTEDWKLLFQELDLYIKTNYRPQMPDEGELWGHPGGSPEFGQGILGQGVPGMWKPARKRRFKDTCKGSTLSDAEVSFLDSLMEEVGETFHEALFRHIDESGMKDSEVYRNANVDRRLFSKIRSNPAYHPRKNTVLALAIGLKLSLDETRELLALAEYALSPASKGDLIIKYFIEREKYDIMAINFVLAEYDQEPLGGNLS